MSLGRAVFAANTNRDGRGDQFDISDRSAGAVRAELPAASADGVDEVVTGAAKALDGHWLRWKPADRGRLCQRIASALLDERDHLAEVVVNDAGLPVSVARADIDATARAAECGLPSNVANAVTGTGVAVGERLVRHSLVDHITFTGIQSSMRTAGQACSAGTRILIDESVRHEFAGYLAALAAAVSVGRADADPDVGPVITDAARDAILAAVTAGVAEGRRPSRRHECSS